MREVCFFAAGAVSAFIALAWSQHQAQKAFFEDEEGFYFDDGEDGFEWSDDSVVLTVNPDLMDEDFDPMQAAMILYWMSGEDDGRTGGEIGYDH